MDISSIQTYDKKPLLVKEPGSAITHFIGMIYSLAFMPVLIDNAIKKHSDASTVLSLIIFMVSMILLYAASAAYHTFDINEKVNRVLKKTDHMMIFAFIAGSYTPVCVIVLGENGGYILLAVVWGLAILGMLFKFYWVTCPKWISSVIYIGMGWSCISVMPQLAQLLPHNCFVWLLTGGIIYTVGGVIYALKLKIINTRFKEFGSHEIFHLFVMGGSICHFICMYQLI